MRDHEREFRVRSMCRVLGVHPSGYYAWRRAPLSARAKDDRRVLGLIKQSWLESGSVYGYRKVARCRIENPITFGSLWDWYGRWSSGDLPSYQSRREFVGTMVNPVINLVRTGHQELPEPTGWQRVDRCIGELCDCLASAGTEERNQAVGLLGREVLISLASRSLCCESPSVPVCRGHYRCRKPDCDRCWPA